MMSRRSLLRAAAGLAAPAAVLARPGLDGSAAPFVTLDKPILADASRIIEFIAYTCTACQRFHGALQSWAATLPKRLQYQVIAIPLMGSHDEMALLFYRAALSLAQPARLRAFDLALLDNLSINGNRPDRKALIDAIKIAQVDHGAVARVPQQRIIQTMMHWRDKAAEYGVKVTPTIAIGGRYTTTPDAVPGREDLFPIILNGLVSRII